MCSVIPLEECKICFESKPVKDMAVDLKCWKPLSDDEENDHAICKKCFETESARRKSIGLQYPNECIICRPHQERIQTYTININENITVHVSPPRDALSFKNYFEIICVMFVILFVCATIGTITWNLTIMIHDCLSDQKCEWNFQLFLPVLYSSFGFLLFILYMMVLSPCMICFFECRNPTLRE